jgi:hypothetical protein
LSARTPLDPTPPEVKLSSAKRWGIALLVVGGLIVAVNISHANEAPAAKPAPTTSAPAPAPTTSAPAPAPEPEPTTPEAAPEPQDTAPAPAPEPQDNGTQAHTWIKDNYPATSWVTSITSIKAQGDVLWAETDLFPDSDAERPASAICAALSAYQISETDAGFTGVTVRAVDDQRLAWRMSLSDKC